jgi:Putative beta-lactamase-inhibitor-like, PepSY-like
MALFFRHMRLKITIMKTTCYFLSLLLLLSTFSFSQVTKVPQVAKDNFARQYPEAHEISWDNDVINVNVRFELNGERMNAEYSNKGIWKKTEKDWDYDKLPDEVRDGFDKSKYADREVVETVIVYLPGDVQQYRLKVEKNDVQKKYLFFDEDGRLIREAITL